MNDGKFRLGLVKISNGEAVPEDEPVFILRARDRNAVDLLAVYRELCAQDKCNDYQMTGIEGAIARFMDFAERHPEKMKQPGITRGI